MTVHGRLPAANRPRRFWTLREASSSVGAMPPASRPPCVPASLGSRGRTTAFRS